MRSLITAAATVLALAAFPLQAQEPWPARPLRMVVRDLALRWLPEENACELQFSLRGGSFATTVVRELVHSDDATGAEEHA